MDSETCEQVDFWREPLALNQSVDIFLSPDVRKLVEQLVNKNQMQHHFVFDNLQRLAIFFNYNHTTKLDN